MRFHDIKTKNLRYILAKKQLYLQFLIVLIKTKKNCFEKLFRDIKTKAFQFTFSKKMQNLVTREYLNLVPIPVVFYTRSRRKKIKE